MTTDYDYTNVSDFDLTEGLKHATAFLEAAEAMGRTLGEVISTARAKEAIEAAIEARGLNVEAGV